MKFARRMERLGTESAFEVLARARTLERRGRTICHLEIGEPDFDTPAHIIDGAKRALDDGFTHYGPAAGDPVLRRAIADYAGRKRGITIEPDEVVVTPGAKPILFFALLALVDEGDEVLVPDPGFPIYASVVEMAGGVAVPYHFDEARGFRIDRATLRRARGGIFNTPQNPTGGILDGGDWECIAGLDLDWLISDEVYSEILYDQEHQSALAHPELRPRTILCDGFSKTYAMTGWRLGFGVMPKDLAARVAQLQINCTSCAASFTQVAAIEALEGTRDDVVAMVDTLRRRRDLIVEGLDALPGFRCPMPDGAFYAFPNVGAAGDADELAAALLDRAGVACLAGSAFGPAGKDYLRFSYAASEETLRDALRRMRAFLA